MTCYQFRAELAECARSGAAAGPELQRHRTECPECAERWAALTSLNSAITALRATFANERTSAFGRARTAREYEFFRRERTRRQPRWAAVAAAAILLAAALSISRTGTDSGSAAVGRIAAEPDGDFVSVPYSQPLAEGEWVMVCQAQLTPAALGRMGFTVAALHEPVTADVLVGEDGLPRAVRIPANDF